MKTYNIAVLPGDGIGREILPEGMKVLEAVSDGFKLNFTEYPAGAKCYLQKGKALPRETLESCRNSHAIFLGAMGLPDVRNEDTGEEIGNQAVLHLRFLLDLYAGIRPIKLYPGVNSVLKTKELIDYIIVRENTEGLYASFGNGIILRNEIATDVQIITRSATERIMDYAFKLADKRNGAIQDGVSRVTCVDKSNVLRSNAFWRKIYDEKAEKYPNIARDYAYIDAMVLYMVQKPSYYDVIVADNMFGDIISDLGSGTVGGMGLAPSADIGDDNGIFQPAHGSAPDISGQGIANPLAQILSGKMMLEWLGRKYNDNNLIKSANKIKKSVKNFLGSGENLPRDLGGTAKTKDVGNIIADSL